MASATVTSKGQITIPAQVRASLGLDTGDRVEFVELENGQFAIVTAVLSVQSLKGLLRKSETPVSIDDMNVVG